MNCYNFTKFVCVVLEVQSFDWKTVIVCTPPKVRGGGVGIFRNSISGGGQNIFIFRGGLPCQGGSYFLGGGQFIFYVLFPFEARNFEIIISNFWFCQFQKSFCLLFKNSHYCENYKFQLGQLHSQSCYFIHSSQYMCVIAFLIC